MSGRGNTEDATDAVEKKSVAVLKDKATYHNWAFDTIWGISPALNSGYPYLLWQDVSEIPLTGVTFARAVVSLSVGDTLYLTAQQQPATAEMPALTWGSSDEEVATVNTNGRVTAVGVGTATITVSGGGFSATCAVTVKPRAADEYRIGALTVRDANGAALDAIPHGTFLVTVPVTKQYDGGNSLVFLAAYSASDQFRGLLYVEVEDIPLGTTIKITLPVDNTNGEIAQLKAFTIASFSNPIPLGAAVSFSAQ